MANKMPKDSKIKGINEFMKLSIIIPIYKVEPYIERCIQSCIEQPGASLGEDYEIICINDGTPDKSAEIAKEIASSHIGIMVIDQVNKGLSGARNTGIKHATGEYVWFVDSDDYIDNDSVKLLLTKLNNDIDMLNIQCTYVFENGQPQKKRDVYPIGKNANGLSVLAQGKYPTMAQLTIYRASFLISNNLKFYEGIFHEDAEFTPRALFFAKKIESFPYYIYNYLQRTSNSITAQYKLKNAKDAIIVCDSLYSFCKTKQKFVKVTFIERISQILFTHLYRFRFLSDIDKETIFEEMKSKRYIYLSMLGGKSFKCKVAGMMLFISPQLSYRILKSMQPR